LASDYASSGSSSGSSGGSSGGSGGRPPPRGRGRGRYTPRRKVCQFCVDKVDNIDYKDVTRLRRYISERGKIEPRRKTGTCAKHQRRLSRAIKRARQIALLPFAPKHIQELGGWFQPPPFMPTTAPHPVPTHATPGAPLSPAAAWSETAPPLAPVDMAVAELAPAESEPTTE
jgi:small subunit ribosomal protein S18